MHPDAGDRDARADPPAMVMIDPVMPIRRFPNNALSIRSSDRSRAQSNASRDKTALEVIESLPMATRTLVHEPIAGSFFEFAKLRRPVFFLKPIQLFAILIFLGVRRRQVIERKPNPQPHMPHRIV